MTKTPQQIRNEVEKEKEIRLKDIRELILENITPCYALIYKTKKGQYRVDRVNTKEENKEIKSIFVGLLYQND